MNADAFGWRGDAEKTETPLSSLKTSRGNDQSSCRIINPECINSGSRVIADLEAQCMCVDDTCFEISIGKYGPKMTRNGTGIIGNTTPGHRYQTIIGKTSTEWDNDGLSMGIPQNSTAAGVGHITNGGKWIHKSGLLDDGTCVPPKQNLTLGCIGVACEDWPTIKRAKGSSMTVCGGASKNNDIVSANGCQGWRDCKASVRFPLMTGCRLYSMRQKARGLPEGECTESPHSASRTDVDDYVELPAAIDPGDPGAVY